MLKHLKYFKVIYKTTLYKNKRQYSSIKYKSLDKKQQFTEKIDQLFETFKNKIYYSSIYESNVERLSFKKKKVVKQIIQKHDEKRTMIENNYKPFPITLKLLQKDIGNIYDNSTNDLNNLQDELEQKLIKIGAIKNALDEFEQTQDKPKRSWLQDYEYFDDSKVANTPEYGTPDPQEPISKVNCGGCGAKLHCADSSIAGYIPKEIFKGRTDDELKVRAVEKIKICTKYLLNTNILLFYNLDYYLSKMSFS